MKLAAEAMFPALVSAEEERHVIHWEPQNDADCNIKNRHVILESTRSCVHQVSVDNFVCQQGAYQLKAEKEKGLSISQ